MSTEKLFSLLHSLREEMQQTKDLDPAVRDQFEEIADALQSSLEQDAQPETGGFLDRLRELEQQFEESHPQLTNSVGQVADFLARVGI